MIGPDVPADLTPIDRPGVTIAADAPRRTIGHRVLAEIPAAIHTLAEGAEESGLVPRGKPIGDGPVGVRGAKGCTGFLRDAPSTAGGYDGPPKNDARTHREIVIAYALDVPTIGLTAAFDGRAGEAAMAGHILARGFATAPYSRSRRAE